VKICSSRLASLLLFVLSTLLVPSFSAAAPLACDEVRAHPDTLWPPNHKFTSIDLTGGVDHDRDSKKSRGKKPKKKGARAEEKSDQGDSSSITITSIFQDEPINAKGDGNTVPDARGIGGGSPEVRTERSGGGDGRVYHINFVADSDGRSCTGTVTVCVPTSRKRDCVDGGPIYDSVGYGMTSFGAPAAEYSIAAAGLTMLMVLRRTKRSRDS